MGKNLVLTIDMRIQKLVEEALGERMGSIVVMRPSTGEILAMVSYPWYDPNIFTSGDRNEYTGLANDPNRPFLNRAIQASYPPASSFKMIMATGIISENAFPQDRLVECTGHVEFGGRTWRCHLRTGHGKLNLYGALGQSCNIYFWQVGRDNLGVDQIVAYSKDFGLGEITGIDIPGEIAGFIPTPAWKSRRFHERWMAGDTMNMAIGQGWTQVTPIQMVNVISMIVNGGTTYRPHLLKEARDPATGEVTWRATPEVMHSSGIDPEVFEVMRRDLRGVIAEGSASYPMNIRSVQIAGKTGTAEVGLNDRWHSWLVSYGPYNSDNPDEQVAVATIVEATNRWEWWATYATAIIYQGIFANQTASEAARTLGFPNVMPTLGRRE
jgi:penicillin-binding protein 2